MRRALLPLLLLAGCGYVFDTTTGEPVPEPEFRFVRLSGGESVFAGDQSEAILSLRIDRDGRIDFKGRKYTVSEPITPRFSGFLPLLERLFVHSEVSRDLEHPMQPSRASFALVPDARIGWERVRPGIQIASHLEIRVPTGALVGVREGERVAWRTPFVAPHWHEAMGRWTTWEMEVPRWTLTLTTDARDGIDGAALGARITEGPVLLSAADGVPAQVVADALVALNAAGATPVLLSPDAPADTDEETLPGVVIR